MKKNIFIMSSALNVAIKLWKQSLLLLLVSTFLLTVSCGSDEYDVESDENSELSTQLDLLNSSLSARIPSNVSSENTWVFLAVDTGFTYTLGNEDIYEVATAMSEFDLNDMRISISLPYNKEMKGIILVFDQGIVLNKIQQAKPVIAFITSNFKVVSNKIELEVVETIYGGIDLQIKDPNGDSYTTSSINIVPNMISDGLDLNLALATRPSGNVSLNLTLVGETFSGKTEVLNKSIKLLRELWPNIQPQNFGTFQGFQGNQLRSFRGYKTAKLKVSIDASNTSASEYSIMDDLDFTFKSKNDVPSATISFAEFIDTPNLTVPEARKLHNYEGPVRYMLLPFLNSMSGRKIIKKYITPLGSGDGSSWQQSGSLDEILATIPTATKDVYFLLLKEGLYVFAQSLSMMNGVAIIGGLTENNTFDENSGSIIQRLAGTTTDDTFVFVNDNVGSASLLYQVNIEDTVRGIKNTNSSPYLINIGIFKNSIINGCNGIKNIDSSPIIINGIFAENEAIKNSQNESYGGVICNLNASPTFINTTFTKNYAKFGAAIYVKAGGNLRLYNSLFLDNSPDIIAYSETTSDHTEAQLSIYNTFYDVWPGTNTANNIKAHDNVSHNIFNLKDIILNKNNMGSTMADYHLPGPYDPLTNKPRYNRTIRLLFHASAKHVAMDISTGLYYLSLDGLDFYHDNERVPLDITTINSENLFLMTLTDFERHYRHSGSHPQAGAIN